MLGLKQLKYVPDPIEVDLWMKRYGGFCSISKVKFSQFCRSFDPRDNYYSTLLNRRQSKLTGELAVFSEDTLKLYRSLWRNILTDEGISEGQRQRFERMQDFSAEKMFRMLDLDRDGCFTPGEVTEFLAERGIQLEG